MEKQQNSKRKVVAIPIEEDTSSDSEPPSPSPSPPPKRRKMAAEPDLFPDRSASWTPVYEPRSPSPSPTTVPRDPETGQPQWPGYSPNKERRARSGTPHPLEVRETSTTLEDENKALKKEIETLKQENEKLKRAIIKLAVAN